MANMTDWIWVNKQYDIIVKAEINEKYKIKFFRLRLYFQEKSIMFS